MTGERAKNAGTLYDQIRVTSPLDLPYYDGVRADVRCLGNPAMAFDASSASGDRFRDRSDITDKPLLLLLPGSRPAEISRLMSIFGETSHRVCLQYPDVRIALVVAQSVREHVLESASRWQVTPIMARSGQSRPIWRLLNVRWLLPTASVPSLMRSSSGCKPRFITMLTIAADRAVVPKFVQDDCNPDNLAAALVPLPTDATARSAQLADQRAALEKARRQSG